MIDKDKLFDQKIRSLLSEAEEPVPSTAWEAIRSRIPAKPVRQAAPWWWAGAALAAAAATALALVLGGTFRLDPAVVEEGDRLAQVQVTEAAGQQSVGDDATAVEMAQEAAEIPTARSVKKTVAPGIQAASTKSVAPQTGVESATTQGSVDYAGKTANVREQGPESPAAEPETAPAGKPATESPTQTGKQEFRVDPFARMAYEDAHRKAERKVSLQLNGLAGTNDKAIASLRGGMMAAPAKVQSESGQSTYITETGESNYAVPISFGLGAKFYLSDRWALGTGVNLSILNRTFPGTYTKDGSAVVTTNNEIKHSVQYVGVPVNLYFDLLSSHRIKMYTFAGGSIEKGIVQKYIIPGSNGPEYWKKQVPGLQGSAGLGAGFQMNVTDRLGVYVDPSARYYFGADQPKTIRTQQNVMFNLEFGIRFDL